jgi:hypothetical protein
MNITNEEIFSGQSPAWLYDHIISEISNPIPYSQGGLPKLLIIYPNDESRLEMLSKIADEGYVIDRNLHHTVNSLMISIMNDFRMPQLFKNAPYFDSIIHEECVKESTKLGFPLINPLPTMHWGHGKTRALLQLHKFLSSESVDTFSWQGPGIPTISKILTSLETKMNFTYPDFLSRRLVSYLEKIEKPFSLIGIDGIIMLNHSPTTSKAYLDFISAVSYHCPIHQLANKGNFRKGEHGLLLLDNYPVKDESSLPTWVPKHKLDNLKETRLNKIRRVLI